MDLDLQKLIKDKRFQVAAAGVGGIGALVLYKRSKAGGGSGGGTPNVTGTPVGSAGYVQGGADTTGTDVASFLSNYSQSLQDQLNEWGGNLNDTLTAIQSGQTGGQTTPPPASTPPTLAKSFTVHKGDNVDNAILQAQKASGNNPHALWDWLYKNTNIKGNVTFTPGGDHTKNTFNSDMTYYL